MEEQPAGAGSAATVAVDLEVLWRAGKIHMPTTANTFSQASAKVHRTGRYADSAFSHNGGIAPAYTTWLDLRDQVQRIIVDTCTNLTLAGDALVQIADDYLATDDEARAKFDEDIKVQLEAPELAQPPGPPPPPPLPGAPQQDSGSSIDPWLTAPEATP